MAVSRVGGQKSDLAFSKFELRREETKQHYRTYIFIGPPERMQLGCKRFGYVVYLPADQTNMRNQLRQFPRFPRDFAELPHSFSSSTHNPQLVHLNSACSPAPVCAVLCRSPVRRALCVLSSLIQPTTLLLPYHVWTCS